MEIDYSRYPSIGIFAYSDFYDVPAKKVWGDYWLKEDLGRGLREIGYPVNQEHSDICLHLFGEPLGILSKDTYNILWIHSHPDWITPSILSQYQKIYCISELFTEKIRSWGFKAEHLMIPTSLSPVAREKQYDLIFVGNTKQQKIRKIIADLGHPPYRIKIWGWGWKGLIPEEWYGGEYYEHSDLAGLYASARIVLNDHHEDMQREGFINPRILDVLASGGFVISDPVKGLEEIFGCSVPVYHTPVELHMLIGNHLQNDDFRERLAKEGQEIALRYPCHWACKVLVRHIESVFANP